MSTLVPLVPLVEVGTFSAAAGGRQHAAVVSAIQASSLIRIVAGRCHVAAGEQGGANVHVIEASSKIICQAADSCQACQSSRVMWTWVSRSFARRGFNPRLPSRVPSRAVARVTAALVELLSFFADNLEKKKKRRLPSRVAIARGLDVCPV